MKQKTYTRLFSTLSVAILILSGLAGCVDNKFDEPEIAIPGNGDVSLELVINSYGTRADGTAFSAAEKRVTSVDLFFFKDGTNDTQTALYYLRGKPTMSTESAKSNTGKLTVSVPEDIFKGESGNTLFNTCKVFAAVNTDVTLDYEDITLGELKALKAETDWFIDNSLMSESEPLPNDFNGFVMFTVNPEGDEVTYDEDNKKISGTIMVDKLTSKINLQLAFGDGDSSENLNTWTITAPDPNTPEDGSKNWKVYIPSPAEKGDDDTSVFGDAVEAYIVNGVKTVPLSGAFTTNEDGELILKERPTEDDLFDLWAEDTENEDNAFMNYAHGFVSVDNAAYPYVVESPFYTYPNAWSDGVLSNPTHLILKVNWYDSGSSTETGEPENLLETYYKIPLNRSEGVSKDKILSNYHYNVKVKINTLGGLHFGEPLLLDDCSYDILPWGTLNLDAKLRFTRYLEIRQQVTDRDGTVYTAIMNNLETASIPFYSSHKVRLESASISFYDNYTATVGEDDIAEPTIRTVKITDLDAFQLSYDDLVGDNNYAGVYIDEISNRLTIKHLFHPVHPDVSDGHYVHVLENQDIKMPINGKVETINFKANTYSYYDITLVLEHTDGDSGIEAQNRTITIRQYPQLYLDITFNPGGDRSWDGGEASYRRYGYVFVNGTRSTGIFDGSGREYGGVRGVAAGLLSSLIEGAFNVADNPMMYIINATNLGPEDAPLHIGDPRVKYTDNDLDSPRSTYADGSFGNASGTMMYETLPLRSEDDKPAAWMYKPIFGSERNINASAPVWKDGDVDTSQGNRYLSYYYPTDETPVEEVMNTIAPRYRVASAHGNARQKVNRKEARRRCATYQERGFPAGRWRLPTYGELLYISRLSYKRIIPKLFEESRRVLLLTEDTPYWAASGLYMVKDNSVEEYTKSTWTDADINGYVRCVYDEWYWTYKDANGFEKPDMMPEANWETFYWGDKLKNNPQRQD